LRSLRLASLFSALSSQTAFPPGSSPDGHDVGGGDSDDDDDDDDDDSAVEEAEGELLERRSWSW